MLLSTDDADYRGVAQRREIELGDAWDNWILPRILGVVCVECVLTDELCQ